MLSAQTKNKLVKNYIKKRTFPEFTFPELKDSDKYLMTLPSSLKRGTIEPGSDESAFPPFRLKDPRFKKELQRLQEKHKMTGYV